MNDQPTRQFKGVWIPSHIWLHPELTLMEKCLIAEIDSFSNCKKGCIAGDAFFAERFQCSQGRMANVISSLRTRGFIETISFNGRNREIRVKADFTETVKADFTETVKAGLSETVKAESAPNTIREGTVERTPRSTDAVDVLGYLNVKAGRRFRETKENIGFITARLSEPGVDVDGVKQMIDRQVALWVNDDRMREYLRPETLFNRTKFEGYYGSRLVSTAKAQDTDSIVRKKQSLIQIIEEVKRREPDADFRDPADQQKIWDAKAGIQELDSMLLGRKKDAPCPDQNQNPAASKPPANSTRWKTRSESARLDQQLKLPPPMQQPVPPAEMDPFV